MNEKRILFLESLDPQIKSSWLDFWSASSHAGWRQHPSCGQLGSALGMKAIYVVGTLNGKISFIGIFCFRPIWLAGAAEAVCLRGPVFEDVSFAQWCLPQINNYFRSLKVGTVRIGPYWRFPEAAELERTLFSIGYARYETTDPLGRRKTGIIDIRISNEELLMSFSHSTRRSIREAEKAGIEFRTACTVIEASEFFRHLDIRDKERGIARISQDEYETIFSLLATDNGIGVLINAYHQSSFLGGLLVVRGGKIASYSKFVVSDSSRILFPKLRIAPSLFFAGILWAKAQGCEFQDLEGYSTESEGPPDQVFINRYKAGFSPTAVEALGQYFIVSNHTSFLFQRVFGYIQRVLRLPQRLVYKVRFELKKRMILHREKQI